jgi:hypothetical protein
MSKPKYITLRAVGRPKDFDRYGDTYGSAENGPYVNVEYKDMGGHILYPNRVWIVARKLNTVDTDYKDRYSPRQITDEMLIDLAKEFIQKVETAREWGYDVSDWKITDSSSLKESWIEIE